MFNPNAIGVGAQANGVAVKHLIHDRGRYPMREVEIQTENRRLVLQTAEETLAAIEALSPAGLAHVSDDWLARVRASTGSDPWTLGFDVVHRASAQQRSAKCRVMSAK